MKILYFISVVSHGRGGHGHSLMHISSKMSEKHSVGVVSIGPGDSSHHQTAPEFIKHIFFNGFNILQLKNDIKKVISDFKPDVIHFFDDRCYNIIRLLINTKSYKIILNKCGGPNPQRHPYINDLILFSYENLQWFQSQKKFRKSNLILIPNRVYKIKFESNYQPLKKEKEKFNFVRITRIGKFHKKSIFDSINLIEYLHHLGHINTQLYIIGTVEDYEIFKIVKKHKLTQQGVIKLLTDDCYTKGASKMLYLADAVLGTGRSLMEATSLKLPVLTFNANDNLPVLLTKENFDSAFQTNFSTRNVFENLKNNKENIKKLIADKDYYKSLSDFSGEMFGKYFDINEVERLYSEIYENLEHYNNNFLKDLHIIIRHSISYYIGFRKNISSK